MSRMDEIREREHKATPGPWVFGLPYFEPPFMGDHQIAARDKRRYGSEDIGILLTLNESSLNTEGNRNFIAHAREDIPYLLAEVEKLEKKLYNAYGVAQTAIYLSNNSEGDYLEALYEILYTVKPDATERDTQHGKEYIEVEE